MKSVFTADFFFTCLSLLSIWGGLPGLCYCIYHSRSGTVITVIYSSFYRLCHEKIWASFNASSSGLQATAVLRKISLARLVTCWKISQLLKNCIFVVMNSSIIEILHQSRFSDFKIIAAKPVTTLYHCFSSNAFLRLYQRFHFTS